MMKELRPRRGYESLIFAVLVAAPAISFADAVKRGTVEVVETLTYERIPPANCDTEASPQQLRVCGEYALFEQGDSEAALSYWSSGLSAARDVGDLASIRLMASGIAAIFSANGNYAAAVPYQEEAVKTSETYSRGIGNQFTEDLRDLALLYDRARRFDDAHVAWHRLSDLARSSGSDRSVALNLLDLSRHEHARGAHERAVEYYEAALDLLDKEGDAGLAAPERAYIVESYQQVGRVREAVRIQEGLVHLARRVGDPSILADSLDRYAAVLRAAGRPDDARRAESEASALRHRGDG